MSEREQLQIALVALARVESMAELIYRGVIERDDYAKQAKHIMDACHNAIIAVKNNRNHY